MDRSNIDKIAQTPEDRMFLAKIWDKVYTGIRKDIPAYTTFLSEREQEMVRFLFGEAPGLQFFGGCEEAERKIFTFLPDYLDNTWLNGEDAPIVCLRATYYAEDRLSHRDFLGALMGIGIARETVGDIYVGKGSCDFLVTAEIAPYLLQNFISAGRTKFHLEQISLQDMQIPALEVKEIKDTLASLRLDSVISSGFRISRGVAAQHIAAGRAAVSGVPCEKADKAITEGTKIAVRGLGKIKLVAVNGQTKKGRISVVIHRYI